MRQHIRETVKGLRLTIDPHPLLAEQELLVLRRLLTDQIEHRLTDRDVAQCLRYARIHVLQAIRVLDAKREAA